MKPFVYLQLLKQMQLTLQQVAAFKRIYVEDCCNPFKKPDPREIATRYEMSETFLKEGFRFLFQQPIYRCWLEHSMKYAKQVLEDGMAAKEVAILLMYSSPQSFTRAFKSVHGHPPSDFSMQK